MAPSNSTKKLAKVARSGKKRSIRESSDRTYPLAIAAIVVVGAIAVFWGRSERAQAQRVEPTLNDHWHSAYGTYVCDAFSPPPTDQAGDPLGIHSHQDGIIHIHPFSSAATGEGARIGKFLETVGIDVTGGKLVTPDGTTYDSGTTTCPNGEVGTLVLVEWKSADDPTAAPTVIRENIADARFVNDRMAFTLAFVPEAEIGNIPRPESIPQLDQLTDIDPSQLPSTTTTVGDGSGSTLDSTTVTGEGTATSTVNGAGSTSTVSPVTTIAGAAVPSTAPGATASTAPGATAATTTVPVSTTRG